MDELLRAYLAQRDYQAITKACIAWIRNWFSVNGPDSPAVIGISGGKDSTTVAALCVEALGRDRVFGVLMPDGFQRDIDAARQAVAHLGISSAEINIRNSTEAVKSTLAAGLGCESFNAQVLINIPPRVRMTTLYAVSQSMNGRVSNNCNRSENHVGYSTIFGDAAGDFSPLANLTVSEIRVIGQCLGLPRELVTKIPADGLSGKTDEDALGFTYEQLDTYILTGICEDPAVREMIDRRHRANLFKHRPMAEFEIGE